MFFHHSYVHIQLYVEYVHKTEFEALQVGNNHINMISTTWTTNNDTFFLLFTQNILSMCSTCITTSITITTNKDGERFVIPQTRNQDGKKLLLTLTAMSAPTFNEGDYAITCKVVESEPDPDHQRPLSAILDVKDEILDKLQKLFLKKPIWKKDQLFNHPSMKNYAPEVITYTIQWAIDNSYKIRDKNGREGRIELKEHILS